MNISWEQQDPRTEHHPLYSGVRTRDTEVFRCKLLMCIQDMEINDFEFQIDFLYKKLI